jgi:peptidoglycan/xylan/chitin deacetylase (PgdA/CDA1 family)
VTARARLAGAALLAINAAPAVTTISPLRARLFPGLTGLGWPDHVALTFDDGPDPASTPYFIDALATYRIRATFFLLGSMLERAPQLGRELVDAGHEVAVHGWEHRNLLSRGPAATHDDLARARDLIAEITGSMPTLYRPPYGVLSASALVAARRLDLRPVLWSAWGRDWSPRATADSVLDTVSADLRGGGTVLLHDSDCTSSPGSWHTTLGALPRLIDQWQESGLRIGPLAEHGVPNASGVPSTSGVPADQAALSAGR